MFYLGAMPFVTYIPLTPPQGRHVRGCLEHLRTKIHWSVEEPFLKQVRWAGRPPEIVAIYDRCQAIERDIKAAEEGNHPALIDPAEAPIIKLAVLENRQSLNAVLEAEKTLTFHPGVLANLDQPLEPYRQIMQEPWFEQHDTFPMPRLTDFLSLGAAISALGNSLVLKERSYDEKFSILQAPSLLQPDIAYFREHCRLRGSSFSVAYLDIDDFKENFNKVYGETTVDRNVLPRFMLSLEAFVFGRGYAYRYGGDEYVVLLPGLGQNGAADALDELRLRVRQVRYAGVTSTTSVSIGLCAVGPDCFLTGHEIEHYAEAAKNFAKQNGKNRIAVHPTTGVGLIPVVVRGAAEAV
jgi:diguanylate cyclase (GGDEF)-like protein